MTAEWKLSEVQVEALYLIREYGALNEFSATAFIGKSRNQTLRSLERKGLVRYYPTPEHWKLTREGREWLDDEDTNRANTYAGRHWKAVIATTPVFRKRYRDAVEELEEIEEMLTELGPRRP